MNEPLRVTDTGFEVWKMDRTRGRQVFMTRADEDRLCDALRETFGDFQAVYGNERWETPEVGWRNRIGDFPIAPDPPEYPYGVRNVDIYFPWPKWELRGEPLYYENTARRNKGRHPTLGISC